MRNWLLLMCDRWQRVEGNANLSNSPEQKISSIHGNMGTKFCLSECRCSLMSLWKLRRNRIDWFVLSLLESHQCTNWDGVVCSLNSREDSWGFLLITILTIHILWRIFMYAFSIKALAILFATLLHARHLVMQNLLLILCVVLLQTVALKRMCWSQWRSSPQLYDIGV